MYKNNADKLLNQKSVPFCQLPIFLRKILANKTALFLYATLCPIKRKANAQAKSANAHIAFLPTLTRKRRIEKLKIKQTECLNRLLKI